MLLLVDTTNGRTVFDAVPAAEWSTYIAQLVDVTRRRLVAAKTSALDESCCQFVDMNGRHLRIAIASPGADSGSLEDIYGSITHEHTRESKILLDLLSERLNFTYQIILGDSHGLGLRQPDGSFDGLIGLLQTKGVDLIASRVPSLPYLKELFDFSIPLGQEEWATMQQQPPVQNSPTALLSPFEFKVWMLVALSVICIIPVMYVVYRCYVRLTNPPTLRRHAKAKVRFGDYVLFVIVSLLKQNHTLQVKIDSQRILMATWWIVGTVLTTFYTANLTAELARPVKASAVQHPDELGLPENQQIKWVTLQGDTLHFMTRVQGEGFMRALASDLDSGRGEVVPSITRTVRLVEDRGYVWFGRRDLLMEVLLSSYRSNSRNNVTRSKSCTFLVTDETYLSVEYGMLFPKNSTLSEQFNRALGMLDQAGFTTFLQRSSSTGRNPCSSAGTNVVRPLQTADLIGLFYIFIVGLLLSALAFLVERLRSWVSTTRLQSTGSIEADHLPLPPVLIFRGAIDEELDMLSEQIDQILRHSLALDDYG